MHTSGPLLRIQPVNYSRFGLKANPFPIAGLSGIRAPYPLIDTTMDKEVHRFIDETLREKEYGGLAIVGEYGSGKTYTLRYIETLLRTIESRPDAEEVLVIYMERPATSLLALVADACNRIGRVRIRNILLEMVFSELPAVLNPSSDTEKQRAVRLQNDFRQAQKGLFDTSNLLSQLAMPDVVMNPALAIERLEPIGTGFLLNFATDSLTQIIGTRCPPAREASRHLAAYILSSEQESIQLWNQLLTGKLLSDGRTVGQVSGQDLWMIMMQILTHAGYAMVYWLIDEFEELEYQQPRLTSLRSFLADFRDLIDANLSNFAVVLASKVGAWDVYRDLHKAFEFRFSRLVPLPPNTPKDIRALLAARMGLVRESSWSGSNIAPFTDQAIESLAKLSRGNMRVAIEACHVLLWYAATSNDTEISDQTIARLQDISRSFFYARKELLGRPSRGKP